MAEVLGPFEEEGRGAEAAAHFAPPPAGALVRGLEIPTMGIEVKAVVVRWSLAQPFADFCHAVVGLLASGCPVILLSDPTLPMLAEALFERLAECVSGPSLWLLHEDGLDVLRHAAGQPDVAIDWAEPDAGLLPGVVSVRKIRADLEGIHAARAAAEALERERAGWFGSGVVAAPLAPVRIRAMTSEVLALESTSDAGLDADSAASEIVARAFGPLVLGGFSCAAVNRVRIPAQSFSAVSEALLKRLDEVESDPCFDPPFWVLDRPEPSALLPHAKRLGLDEGATLIFERREAQEDGKPYGMVFTNGEERMRTAGAARTLGVVLLMRGEIRS
ncbi:MAG: hypothetical protein ACJAQ3_002114 [Planctomycetota bacterium]|jgi:hypothetical protein